jgi:hypothetical protein
VHSSSILHPVYRLGSRIAQRGRRPTSNGLPTDSSADRKERSRDPCPERQHLVANKCSPRGCDIRPEGSQGIGLTWGSAGARASAAAQQRSAAPVGAVVDRNVYSARAPNTARVPRALPLPLHGRRPHFTNLRHCLRGSRIVFLGRCAATTRKYAMWTTWSSCTSAAPAKPCFWYRQSAP